jgi:hypothetical protein
VPFSAIAREVVEAYGDDLTRIRSAPVLYF